ncbi:hypothetical protein EDC04DRAFT_1523242 [Pisolithus marmoratus]|nr:hypothetical protein EDC04DRAFT_1523242 [Pisolithus marmoratus]
MQTSKAMRPLLRSVLSGPALARCLIRSSASTANDVHKVLPSEIPSTPPPLEMREGGRPFGLNEGIAGVHFYRAEPLPPGSKPLFYTIPRALSTGVLNSS